MTLSFTSTLDFYQQSDTFKFQDLSAEYITESDSMTMGSWKAALETAIERYNEGEITRFSQETFIIGLIYSSINKYRLERGLKPLIYAGVPHLLASWHADQRLHHTGQTLTSALMDKPYHSANLGGISDESIETDLFLVESLGFDDFVGHVEEYISQDETMPDYTNAQVAWTQDQLDNPLNWADYAADVVATIAGTWSGKQFLMQSANTDLFVGMHATPDHHDHLVIDMILASTNPTTL